MVQLTQMRVVTNTALYYGKVNEGRMNKNLKKVATYGIDQCTPLCDVKTAREHLKDCKPYIVDNAISAFEQTTFHEMIAVEYIDVECGCDVNTVTCSGYVWTGVRTAERWWFCYVENAYTGNASILYVDGNDEEHDIKL